jgi:transposase-like protein
MKRVRQWERKRVWADRLKRFAGSGQTVAAFCAAEGCSMPSFYQWKRKLNDHRPSAFAELSVVPSGPAISSSTHACVRLPNGVRIELGTEAVLIETILAQVLKHSLTAAHTGASSC